MTTLTDNQAKLIASLTNEFITANKKDQELPSFGIGSFMKAEKQVKEFKNSIEKVNIATAKTLDKFIRKQVDLFNKDFKGYIVAKVTDRVFNGKDSTANSFDVNKPDGCSGCFESIVDMRSANVIHRESNSYYHNSDYGQGYAYNFIYIRTNYTIAEFVDCLGNITTQKVITSVSFCESDWLRNRKNENAGYSADTLKELIDGCKNVQSKLTKLIK